MIRADERDMLGTFLKRLPLIGIAEPANIREGPDPPDFLLEIENGKIGLEITRSVWPEHAIAKRLQETKCPSLWSNLTRHGVIGTTRPGKKIGQRMSRPLFNQSLVTPWIPSAERSADWVTKIGRALIPKRERYNEPSYPHANYNEDWLLIHDYPPLPRRESTANDVHAPLENLLKGPPGF